MNPFAYLGSLVLYVINSFGALTVFLINAIRWSFRPPFRFRLIISQMEFIGVNSTMIVLMAGLFTGMVLAYQGVGAFSMFHMEYMTGGLVAISMAWELGPVLSSIMVVGRCGSAIAAELGSMKVTEQVDALHALAVESVQYLVVPRIIAGVIMMPMLSLMCVFTGIVGGYVVSVKLLGINETLYMDNMIALLTMDDIFKGMVKALVFGLILSLVGCYKGLSARGGALGVGRATTESVVTSCILILLFDYILTALMFY